MKILRLFAPLIAALVAMKIFSMSGRALFMLPWLIPVWYEYLALAVALLVAIPVSVVSLRREPAPRWPLAAAHVFLVGLVLLISSYSSGPRLRERELDAAGRPFNSDNLTNIAWIGGGGVMEGRTQVVDGVTTMLPRRFERFPESIAVSADQAVVVAKAFLDRLGYVYPPEFEVRRSGFSIMLSMSKQMMAVDNWDVAFGDDNLVVTVATDQPKVIRMMVNFPIPGTRVDPPAALARWYQTLATGETMERWDGVGESLCEVELQGAIAAFGFWQQKTGELYHWNDHLALGIDDFGRLVFFEDFRTAFRPAPAAEKVSREKAIGLVSGFFGGEGKDLIAGGQGGGVESVCKLVVHPNNLLTAPEALVEKAESRLAWVVKYRVCSYARGMWGTVPVYVDIETGALLGGGSFRWRNCAMDMVRIRMTNSSRTFPGARDMFHFTAP